MKPKKDFKVAWTLIYNRACQMFIFQSLHLLMVNAEKTRKRVLDNIRNPCFATNLDCFAVGNRAKAQHFNANLKFLCKKLFPTNLGEYFEWDQYSKNIHRYSSGDSTVNNRITLFLSSRPAILKCMYAPRHWTGYSSLSKIVMFLTSYSCFGHFI